MALATACVACWARGVVNRSQSKRTLYIIVCGGPRAQKVGELVRQAEAAGWTVCVVATPQALKFIDVAALSAQTGYAVPHEYKQPDEADQLPPPDAMIVCPATFNTINKWAAGIADTLALGLLTEAIGKGLPLVAAPAVNSAQEKHPAFRHSVAVLRDAGVTVLYGPGVYEPAQPGSGGRPYDWGMPLRALDEKIGDCGSA
jgi:phosphopantothenoylcysteine synthetase/decarboxylase